MNKVKEMFNSRNAWVTLISVAMLGLTANGLEIGKTPEEILALFSGKTLIPIAILLVTNFFNIFSKLIAKIKDGSWSWAFLKSSNFWTQLVTALSPILIPFLGEDKTVMLSVIAANVANFVLHSVKPTKTL